MTVIFLPDDDHKAPTVVGPVASVEEAVTIARNFPTPCTIWVNDNDYRKMCKARSDRRKLLDKVHV